MTKPPQKFKLIYLDPPWTYRDKANAGKRGASHKYNTLTVDDLCALPVGEIAAADCLLAMWWVPPMPAEAERCLKAWGFRLANMKGFTWRKVSTTSYTHRAVRISRALVGVDDHVQRLQIIEQILWETRPMEAFGMGHYSRGNTEDCLFAVKGSPKIIDHSVRQLINSSRLQHSHKPAEARDRLVRMVGRVRRIELFATSTPYQWKAEGFEIDGRDIRDVLPAMAQRLNPKARPVRA